LKGKMGYMAPEQLFGDTLDRRCDIWAAAVIAWELVARQRMFPSRGEGIVLPDITDRHFPLAQYAPDAPPELDGILRQALSPLREDRPATARALADELAPVWKRAWGLGSHDQVAAEIGAEDSRTSLTRMAAAVTEEDEEEGSPRRKRRPLVWAAAFAVTGFVTVAAVRPYLVEPVQPEQQAPPSVVADPSPAASAPPSAPAVASSAPVAPLRRELTVRSNVPLVALSVGPRVVELPKPRREVVVPAVKGPTQVVARAADGRVREVEANSRHETLEIEFEPRRPLRPRPAPRRPTGLHPM
ncbi:MAG: hypothetical protein AAGA56_12450, partial [Myxococcota bacterium]